MLILHKLQWGNCFSYSDDNELVLDQDKITQLVGENGAGKSSIPLILEEGCFNKNSKGVKKQAIPNRVLNEPYWIKVYFSVDQDQYEIHVERKSSIKAKLYCNGEDISSHTATGTFKTVESLFGKSYKTASQLLYQSTNSSLQFLTATDSVRKAFLVELFGLEEYGEKLAVFKAALTDAEKELSSANGKLSVVSSWLERSDKADLTLREEEGSPQPTTGIESELEDLVREVAGAEARNKEIRKNNTLRQQIKEFDMSLIEKYKGEQEKDVSELQRTIGGLRADQKSKQAQVTKMKKLGATCPTCDQDIDLEKTTSLIEELDAELSSISRQIIFSEEQLKEATAKNRQIAAARKKERDLEEIVRALDKSCSTEEVDVSALESRIKELKTKQSEIITENRRIEKANEAVRNHNAKVQATLDARAEHERELEELKAGVSEKETEVSELKILKQAFSPNGLVAYKLENLVHDLEITTNEYLADLSDGRFSLAFTISKDKLNVSLTDNGTEIEINELSSGELARVNTATLLAIRKLMSSISKTNINVLFLDEVINTIDIQGRERLVEVLMNEPYLNTFIVSHGWSHPLLQTVTVVKEDGISKLHG